MDKVKKFRWVHLFILYLAVFGVLFSSLSFGAKNPKPPKEPIPTKKLKVGCIVSSKFVNYPAILINLLRQLEGLSLLVGAKDIPYNDEQIDSQPIWQYLTANSTSEYFQFSSDFYYNLESMSAYEIELLKERLVKKEADLVLALGTAAGMLVSQTNQETNSMIFSVTDAVESGISKTYEYSGKKNIWVHTDPEKVQRQLRVLFDLFHFKKLGYVYENSTIGRVFVPVPDIKKGATELGFELIEKNVNLPKNDADRERYKNDLLLANKELANEADAIYMTVGKIDPDWVGLLTEPFIQKKLPVLSMNGKFEVRLGALLAVDVMNFEELGLVGAVRIREVLRGKNPGEMLQKHVLAPRIELNLKTAERIDYPVSFDLLLVSDKIYNR